MKEGRSRTDEPGGKVGDFLGAGQSSPGGAGGDSGLHVGGEMGATEIGSHDHLEARDNRTGGLSAPLVKDPLKGADPGSGRKISSRAMVEEGGEEDKKDPTGGEPWSEMVDEAGDAGEKGEDLQGIVRWRVGAAEGGMGEEGQAFESPGAQDPVDFMEGGAALLRG